MIYKPIVLKKDWITWLQDQLRVLNERPEINTDNQIFKTPEGDVATAKDLVGNLLALLTNQIVEIK